MSERETAQDPELVAEPLEELPAPKPETNKSAEPELSPEALELAALRAELQENTARLRTVSVAYRKLQEEFGAFRERQDRQIAVKREVLKGDTVMRLFEPMENLRRSIDALTKARVDEEALGGVEMVWRDFLAGFKDLGLEEVGRKGDAFDPDLHEALTIMPVDDPALDGRVVEVFSAGYRVGSILIRPARVVIGQIHEEPVGEA